MSASAPVAQNQEPRRAVDWQVVGWKVMRIVGKVITYLVLSAGAVLFAMPFLWMVSTSIKPDAFAYTVPIMWIPPEIKWSTYIEAWKIQPFNLYYRNTAFLTVVNMTGIVLSSSLVAFAFARIRFKGRDALFLILLATMMLPGQVTLIPIYVIWSWLHGVNTFWPLIVPEWLANAYNVFLLRQFMMTISPEMDDAARIDGAGWFRIYSQVIMPMSRPALGVVAIQAFTFNWNNFMGPLIYLNEPNKFTIAIGLQLFNTRMTQHMPETMAMSVVALIPVLFVFFIAQRFFIQGIVITGVKA